MEQGPRHRFAWNRAKQVQAMEEAPVQADDQARPSGWYHGWNVVAVCILSQLAANGLSVNAFSLFLHDWSLALKMPISSLQLPMACTALIGAVLAPVVGNLADRFPARRLFAAGLTIMAVFYVAVGAMTAGWQMIALYAVLAPIGLSLSTAIPANALISRWFVRRRGLAMGLSAFGLAMAGAILPPIIARALPHLGWRGIWLIHGLIVGLVVMPLVVAVARDKPVAGEGAHYLQGEAVSRGGHRRRDGGADKLRWGEILSRPNLWLIIAAFVPLLALQAGTTQNVAPYATAHGFDTTTASLFLTIIGVMHVVSNLVLGLVSDRYGVRIGFFGLSSVNALGAALLAFAPGLPLIVAGFVCVGAGGGMFTLVAAGIAAEFGTQGFGRAFGFAWMFIPLAMLAPFAVARTEEVSGSYAPAFLALTGLTLVGGVLILFMRRIGGRAPEPVLV